MEMQNQAFLMKLGHQLITDTDRLWVRIFKAKYIWDGILPQSIRKARSSRLWQGLTEICEVIYASVCWNICDGTTMDFWFDTRLAQEGPIFKYYQGGGMPTPISVSSMVIDSG
ncbi:hypothetical protein V6N11_049968 [Hibiscus sabdariffa]|uniref:Reverse transcriptase zinc-binding domain-containing protein n=1 Tax=Hibiscus sabdariffa TaxID=183260 RepID=A0ABR2T937_9ROSI